MLLYDDGFPVFCDSCTLTRFMGDAETAHRFRYILEGPLDGLCGPLGSAVGKRMPTGASVYRSLRF